MAKGYLIAHITVTDPENYPKYIKADTPVFEKWGAKFVVRGGDCTLVEGTTRERHVVIEFESYEKALACYNSPEYQAAAKLRQAYAQSEILVVEGIPEA